MVAVRGVGHGGLGPGYRFVWEGSRVKDEVAAKSAAGMRQLATELEAFLKSNLHRWTGMMADMAFARVEIVGDRIVIIAGSAAPHTVYHEYRYHPQLRLAMDQWAPKISAAIRSGVGGLT